MVFTLFKNLILHKTIPKVYGDPICFVNSTVNFLLEITFLLIASPLLALSHTWTLALLPSQRSHNHPHWFLGEFYLFFNHLVSTWWKTSFTFVINEVPTSDRSWAETRQSPSPETYSLLGETNTNKCTNKIKIWQALGRKQIGFPAMMVKESPSEKVNWDLKHEEESA